MNQPVSTISLLSSLCLTSLLLTGCTTSEVNQAFDDEPTRLDNNFRRSVAQMIKVQTYHPTPKASTPVSHSLQGWEAETIMQGAQNNSD